MIFEQFSLLLALLLLLLYSLLVKRLFEELSDGLLFYIVDRSAVSG